LTQDSRVTAPPAHQQQQQLMVDFFHMADDWFYLFSYPELYTQSLNRALAGYCLLFDIDGDALTQSTVVWSIGW
jgi:hypothetical protein